MTDNVTLLTDVSKWVGIKVQPAISGNLVGKDTIICYGQNPLDLIPLNAGPSNGNGIYTYRWIKNNDNLNWGVSPGADGVITGTSYDPPSLTDTTYYKRVVTSGRCVDYSSTVTITVLPEITGNITVSPSDSIICEGSLFNALGASAPEGGDAIFKYQWQDSTISGSWSPASGINTEPSYTPDTSGFTIINESRYLRRVVFSGANDVCSSYSHPISLTRYHKIRDNLISADQTICEGTKPVPLSGILPTGGAGQGSYKYIWQDSIIGGKWDTLAETIEYSPDIMSVTKWFRRIVGSSVCKDTTAPLLITVQPSIKNNTISLLSGLTDSTVCSGAIPNKITGNIPPVLSGGDGSFSYRWKYMKNNGLWADTAIYSSDFLPPELKSTTTFSRVTTSGVCKDSASLVRINVLPPIVNTIPADLAVCINTPSAPVAGLTLSGGETGSYLFQWQDSTNIHDWEDVANETNSDLQLPLLSTAVKYRRRVWSGPNNTCSQTSNVIYITITPLPYPVFAGEDILLQSFEFLYKLKASKPILGKGAWSVVSSPGKPSFDNDSVYNTIVRDLSYGPNIFTWKVTNGVCVLESNVKIEILNFKIPEGISPDGNGKNDELTISGLDFSLDEVTGLPNHSIELTIINSAGTQVYYTSNIAGNVWKSWDGKNSEGAELPEGTYYYLLKIISNRSDKFIKTSGFIILKRH